MEGIERANKLIAGLPERILVIRDQRLSSSKSDPNRPGKDLSVNFAPVVFPDFKPAVIQMHPTEREFWRVLNASADTYLDIKVVFNDAPQFLSSLLMASPLVTLTAARATAFFGKATSSSLRRGVQSLSSMVRLLG